MPPTYKTVSLIFANKGLVARYAEDRAPDPAQYLNLDNLECRQENAISSRYGLQSITNNGTISKPLPYAVHSLGRLKSLNSAVYRLAGAGTHLYARTGDTNGAYTDISGGFTLSGDPWQQVVYEPIESALPYAYIFDSAANLKWYGGAAAALQNGIGPPLIPPTCIVPYTFPSGGMYSQFDVIDLFDTATPASGSYTFSNLTSTSFPSRTSSHFTTATLAGYSGESINTGVPVYGQLLVVGTGATQEVILCGGSFNLVTEHIVAFFKYNHASLTTLTSNYLQASIALSTTGSVSLPVALDLSVINGIEMDGSDVFSFGFNVDNNANIASIEIQFFVGSSGSSNYYSATVDISSLAAGWNYLTVPRSAFTASGLAGNPGYDWGFVSAYQITVVTNGSGGATLGFDDFCVMAGPQLTVTGGVDYNYRITFYNANTGTESNPTNEQVGGWLVAPVGQSVSVYFNDAGVVSEVTHWRLYREGGSLTGAWWMVAQIPIAQNAYLDSWPDSQIVDNPELSLTNDPPVTSALISPINSTLTTATTPGLTQSVSVTPSATFLVGQTVIIGTGASQEVVYVSTGGTGSFSAYFQLAHAVGEAVTATTAPAVGLNLACVAFNIVWGAGDPSNPSTLYYSNTDNPEGWSSANTVILGPPSDPITGIVFYRGQLYVWTLSTIYQILPQGTSPPIPIITGSVHGLFANYGIAQAEGELVYQGIDGVYAFAGASQLLSEIIDWIERGITLGPVVPIAPAQLANVKAAFCDNEVYFSYTGTDSNIHRVIYHTVYKRFRNDDVPALSMLYEADTGYLIVGEANGNIYQDRVGDYDDGGWTGGVETETPIQINLTTQLQDFGNIKADKYFQELSLDIDTAGQNLTVTFYYDNLGSSFTDTFTVNTSSRKQVNFNVNNGFGYRSRRLGMQITGGVTSAVTLYQWDIRVMLDAEARQSFDTGNMSLAGSEFAVVKQAWFSYQSQNGPISVSCFLEGSDQAAYTFTLPQTESISDANTNTLGKSGIKVRFPAFKARIWRYVGTCSGDFKLYSESFFEFKPSTSEKGYAKHPLVEATQQ